MIKKHFILTVLGCVLMQVWACGQEKKPVAEQKQIKLNTQIPDSLKIRPIKDQSQIETCLLQPECLKNSLFCTYDNDSKPIIKVFDNFGKLKNTIYEEKLIEESPYSSISNYLIKDKNSFGYYLVKNLTLQERKKLFILGNIKLTDSQLMKITGVSVFCYPANGQDGIYDKIPLINILTYSSDNEDISQATSIEILDMNGRKKLFSINSGLDIIYFSPKCLISRAYKTIGNDEPIFQEGCFFYYDFETKTNYKLDNLFNKNFNNYSAVSFRQEDYPIIIENNNIYIYSNEYNSEGGNPEFFVGKIDMQQKTYQFQKFEIAQEPNNSNVRKQLNNSKSYPLTNIKE